MFQDFEESANWVLLIGVECHGLPLNFWHIFSFCAWRGVVSNQILFLAWSQNIWHLKVWAGFVTGCAFFSLGWLRHAHICIRVTSLHKGDNKLIYLQFFLIRNQFHASVTLHVLSPENCKQCLRVRNWKAETRAENARKSKNKIKVDKSKHKLQLLQHLKIHHFE